MDKRNNIVNLLVVLCLCYHSVAPVSYYQQWLGYILDVSDAETVLEVRYNRLTFDTFTINGGASLLTVDGAWNDLTTFPNLCNIGATLEKLILEENKIADVNATYFDCLRRLNYLSLAMNQLTHFPDSSGPGGTLAT
jgi:hypothetical protein